MQHPPTQVVRFMVEAYGPVWAIRDAQTNELLPESLGDLEGRLIAAEILNRREEEKECKKKLAKVIPFRSH